MARSYNLTLDPADVFQLLDALESRAEAWDKTFRVLRGEVMTFSDDLLDLFVPEECTSSNEAKEIANHFRDIISTIHDQIHAQ